MQLALKANFKENQYTLLSQDDVYGFHQLKNISDKKCAITDFAILLGGYVSEADHVGTGYIRANRTTWYWTKSEDFTNRVITVSESGEASSKKPTKRDGGIRPKMEVNCDGDFKFVNKHEFEYGEYPQTVASLEESRRLTAMFDAGILSKSGKVYTVDGTGIDEEEEEYTTRTLEEYTYNGDKYVRIKSVSNSYGEYLSDNRKISREEDYWVKVEPITWYYDEDKKVAYTKKALISGVQFNNSNRYDGNFLFTNMKKYLVDVFSNDIKPKSVFKPISMDEELEKAVETKKKEIIKEEVKNEGEKRMERQKNPYNFNFDNVSEEDIIRGAIESNVAVFLHGRSSEGKSARVKQFDPDCEIVYLRNATPDSLNGKSVYNAETGEMIDIAPTWFKKLKKKCEDEPNKIHLLFFDEISNALPSIQGMAFNIVLDGEVNGIWKLPENARIVAAGNDMNDSLAANSIAEPLFNRFAHVYINTTVDSWLMWAATPKQSYERLDYKKGEDMPKIHPAIYAYIAYKAFRGQDVLRTPYNGVTPNADPRKWEMASKVLFQTKSPEMLRALVGEEITKDFARFARQQVITVQDVISGNYTQNDLEMNISEKFATAVGLSIVDEANLVTIRNFLKLLGKEIVATFDSLWIHGDEKRLEKIAELKLEEQLMGDDTWTKRR